MTENLISRILRKMREGTEERKAEVAQSGTTRTITVTAKGTTLRYYDSATRREEIITDRSNHPRHL